ncbi:hypothetical protein ACJMK2_040343, partial [Sinanodonta woodiana]
ISQYGSICNGTNIVILQETFDFILATVATHYIARSMGALEDGKENNCSADDHFIMSTPNMAITGETKSNPWKFSECSKREIKTFISSLSNVCFNRLTSVSNVPLDTAGTSFTVDQQCKIIKGTPSYMCRVILGGKYEEMCTGMHCYNATSKMCELVVPTEGTLCGDGKWCINGMCSSSFLAPSATAECVHGDQPVLEFSTTDCNSYISIAPSECYKGNVNLACCKTCSTYASGTEDCLYGNKIATCSIIQRDCYNASINRDCCQACSYYKTIFTDCPYGDRIGSCYSISPRDCYNDTINTNCCDRCRTYNTIYGDCEYGDKATWCASISGWDCYDENINRNCCSTCKSFTSYYPANCEYGDKIAWCKSITSRDCYDATTNSQCCKSCSLYNTYTPNCEYGNRIPDCSLSVGDCYDSRINTACCMTCKNYRTFVLNCEYGNRIASCDSVLGLDCYNASINRNCCQTCLSFKTAYPDCLYGDYVSGCRTSECSTYSADKLKQCCGTCRSILPRTSPAAIIATVTSTDKQPNNQATGSHDTVTAATLSKNASNDGWVAPIVGTIIGLVIVAVGVTSVLCFLRRRQRLKKTKQVQQQQQLKDVTSKIPNMTPSYNSQSNRPPMAPPRDSQESGVSLYGDVEETYTYIYPVDTEDSSGTAANTSVKYGIGYSTNRNDNVYIEPVSPKQCSTSLGSDVTGSSGTGTGYIEPVSPKQCSTSLGCEVTGSSGTGTGYIEPVSPKQCSTSSGYDVTDTSGTGTDYGYLHLGTDVNAYC